MNMQITARTYTSASDMMANSKAIRARLFPSKPVRAIRIQNKPCLIEEQVQDEVIAEPTVQPEWMTCNIRFDAHVMDYIQSMVIAVVPVKKYIATRAKELGFNYLTIIGKSRSRALTLARHQIAWEIKTSISPGISYPELGRFFGGKDHTTMMHAVSRIQKMHDEGTL